MFIDIRKEAKPHYKQKGIIKKLIKKLWHKKGVKKIETKEVMEIPSNKKRIDILKTCISKRNKK